MNRLLLFSFVTCLACISASNELPTILSQAEEEITNIFEQNEGLGGKIKELKEIYYEYESKKPFGKIAKKLLKKITSAKSEEANDVTVEDIETVTYTKDNDDDHDPIALKSLVRAAGWYNEIVKEFQVTDTDAIIEKIKNATKSFKEELGRWKRNFDEL